MDDDALRDRVRGAMVGVSIGDALGWPVETLSREQILQTLGPDGVTDFMDSVHAQAIIDPDLLRAQMMWFQGFTKGSTTDDTQGTLACARSLVDCRGFNLKNQVHHLFLEFLRSRTGWGTSTVSGLLRAVQHEYTHGAEGRRFQEAAQVEPGAAGLGDGVAMKMAPLAIWHFFAESTITNVWSDVRQMGMMTHADARAWVGALAVLQTIRTALQGIFEPRQPGVFLPELISTLARLEYVVLERECFYYVAEPDHISMRLQKLVQPGLFEDGNVQDIAAITGVSSNVLEAVPFSIGVFHMHPRDFRTAVLAAVNAGGDTDTNAAMVGAMVGANVGYSAIPQEWAQFSPVTEELFMLADALVDIQAGIL